jgi:hypothetical protein
MYSSTAMSTVTPAWKKIVKKFNLTTGKLVSIFHAAQVAKQLLTVGKFVSALLMKGSNMKTALRSFDILDSSSLSSKALKYQVL